MAKERQPHRPRRSFREEPVQAGRANRIGGSGAEGEDETSRDQAGGTARRIAEAGQ
ncbi:unnamed protein product [Symbiodinium sp. CCMP2592]|nr:unnamed protein product [Symbiodinium sp. CCMP2592]